MEELKALNVDFVTAKDVSQILGCRPQSIRNQAHKNAGLLGFPVTVLGNKVLIPRKSFIAFLEHN